MSRVAEILLAQGRTQADLARQRGQIWGEAIANIGQIPAQMQQQSLIRAREQRLNQQAASEQALTALRLQDAQDARADQTLTGELVQQYRSTDAATGHLRTDHEAVYQGLLAKGRTKAAENYLNFANAAEQHANDVQNAVLATEAKKQAWRANVLANVADAPAEERRGRYATMMGTLSALAQNDPVLKGLPPEYPGDAAFQAIFDTQRTHEQRLKDQADAAERALKESTTKKNLAEALKAEAEAAGGGPPTEAKMDAEYQRILSKIAQRQPLSAEEQATKTAFERRKTLVPSTTVLLNAPAKQEARADRSYQQNVSALTALEKPINERAERIGRLTDTLNQGTTQAYALLAPELLTVMAGGQGSGLRMNEAEIARIIGGKSRWEQLKGRLQTWSTDPTAASSITPEQIRQIRSLVDAVQAKVTAKQAAVQRARQRLVDADDVDTHRQVMADLDKQLNDIDAGSAAPRTTTGGADPLGLFKK